MTDDQKRVVDEIRSYTGVDDMSCSDVCDLKNDALKLADTIEQLATELERVTRERDAAVRDILHTGAGCRMCKKSGTTAICKEWKDHKVCKWEWRGLCAENGGDEDGKADWRG